MLIFMYFDKLNSDISKVIVKAEFIIQIGMSEAS